MSTAWYLYPESHGYITAYDGPNTDTPHYAEDIATPEHTELTAILSGTVKRADYQAWGGEIFIQPDDKSYPQYYMYHTDLNQVSAGQHVTAGQDIALSGGQTSGGYHPVTDGESTGPHTHLGWFTKFVTPPETGYTIPYGPDPSNLIQLAESGGTGGGGAASNFAVPTDIYNAVEPSAKQYGVPDAIWETVASVESGFNPTASGDNGTSYGLFQLHRGGQLGTLTAQQAYDPITNARAAMPAIGSAWSALSGTFDPASTSWWQDFAARSGHPGGAPGDPVTNAEAARLQAVYQSNGSNSASSASQCQPPPWNQPWLWPSYWACQAQQSAANTVQQAASQYASWIGSSIGPFLLRAGVGVTGIVLIYLGAKDIVDALKNEPVSPQNNQSQPRPAKKESSKKEKRQEKKESKKDKKEEKKEDKTHGKEEQNDKSDKSAKPSTTKKSGTDAEGASGGAGAGAGADAGVSSGEIAAAAV